MPGRVSAAIDCGQVRQDHNLDEVDLRDSQRVDVSHLIQVFRSMGPCGGSCDLLCEAER